ncbi:hypothetical protein ACTWP6_04975 [Mycobacterium sp. 4D054]|uniref:hypothetical protein n=1 Tax=Mycobacterium sp. 4D054 TaxID=3457440 RepID=UPI003FCFA9DC
MKRDPDQLALWYRCIVCREVILGADLDPHGAPPKHGHAMCAVAAYRWHHHIADYGATTPGARHRRHARRGWVRRADAPALRVVS